MAVCKQCLTETRSNTGHCVCDENKNFTDCTMLWFIH